MRRRSGERRSARRAASVCIAALLALAESATDVEAQVDGLFSPVEPAFARRFPSPEVTGTPGIATLRSRVVRIDVEALADARAGVAAAEAAGRGDAATLTLNLNLFDDVVFSGIVERTNPTASGTGYVLSGRLDEVEPGTLTLLVYEEGVVGTVRTPTATYSIRPLGDGAHAVGQIDTSGLPPGGEPLVPRSPSPDATPGPSGADRPVAAADDGSVIDVAVFHTPAARTGVRDVTGVSGITALIDLMFENANAAYRDSGAIQRIRLVRTQGVDYVASDSQDDLRRLTEKDDGFMDEVHQVRDEYGADLVHLITANKDVCGRAWQLLYTSYDFAPNGFGLTGYNCELGDYSFSHELGHNMGLRHDRYAQKCEGQGEGRPGTCNATIDNLPHPYSYGYVNQRAFEAGVPVNRRWITIMAYDWRCKDAGFPQQDSRPYRYCERVRNFSSPGVSLRGDALGVSGDLASQEVTGPSDAVRTLDATRSVVANLRPGGGLLRCTVDLGQVTGTRTLTEDWSRDCSVELFGDVWYVKNYRFTLSRTSLVTIDLASPAVPAVTLLNAGGGHLDSSFGIDGSSARIARRLAAGTYTIRTSPDGFGVIGSFTLTLTVSSGFTDDPIVAGVTVVKAVHFTELRERIDVLRGRFGLAAFSWLDPTLGNGVTTARHEHLGQLRTALDEAHDAAGRVPRPYTDDPVQPGVTAIKAVHIEQLRHAVEALEE